MVRRMYVVRPKVSAAWEERRRKGQVLERETAAGSTGAIVRYLRAISYNRQGNGWAIVLV